MEWATKGSYVKTRIYSPGMAVRYQSSFSSPRSPSCGGKYHFSRRSCTVAQALMTPNPSSWGPLLLMRCPFHSCVEEIYGHAAWAKDSDAEDAPPPPPKPKADGSLGIGIFPMLAGAATLFTIAVVLVRCCDRRRDPRAVQAYEKSIA